MSKAETDFPDIVAEDVTQDVQPDPASGDTLTADAEKKHRNVRQLAPVIAAGSLTFIWAAAGAYFFLQSNDAAALVSSLPTLSTLIAGFSTPIAIFWLVALAFQRTDPLLERRLAIAQNLHKAIAPVEAAEQRLGLLNKTLRKELENIDAVADLAADRIGNLENRFQEQINNLFSAAADTEARTTSIRDILERERGAIDSTTKDVEGRFKALEEMVERMANQLEGTGRTVEYTADQARARIDLSFETIDKATGEFEVRMDAAGSRAVASAKEIGETAESIDASLKAVSVNSTGVMDTFRADVEGLHARSTELSDHMAAQGDALKSMAEMAAAESEKIEKTLRSHVGEIQAAATETLQSTNELSEEFTAKSQSMSSHINQTMERAKTLLDEAGGELDKHCSTALEASKQLNQQIVSSTVDAGDAAIAHAERADQLLMDGIERTQTALANTMHSISEHSETASKEAEGMANRTLNHIRQLRAGVEEQLEELAKAGQQAGDALGVSADAISNKSAELAARSEETGKDLAAVQDQMVQQSDVISNVLNDTRMKLSRLEEDLTNQREVLNAASNEAADRVIEAAERFSGHSRMLQEAANNAGETIDGNSGQLLELISDINTVSEASKSALSDATTALGERTAELRVELTDTGAALSGAAEAFAGERGRIRSETEQVVSNLNKATDNMSGEITRFSESSFEAANRLDAASQALMDQTQRAQSEVRESVDATGAELAATMDEISSKANERITVMQEEMETTLARVLANYQETADQAEKESALLTMRLGNESDKIASRAEMFIEKTADIEKRIASATKNDFARTSKLVMESLQSIAIDINKALSNNLPDEVWKEYLEGDKSLFIKRTLKIGDRKTRKAIGEKFSADPEFREAVSRYCRDFEGLMERVMLNDKGSAMAVTMISSDMGKLYVLLGQSLKKFS